MFSHAATINAKENNVPVSQVV